MDARKPAGIPKAKNAERLSGRRHLRRGGGLGIVQAFDLKRLARTTAGNEQKNRRNDRQHYRRFHNVSFHGYDFVQ
jgi:hypothetical protein